MCSARSWSVRCAVVGVFSSGALTVDRKSKKMTAFICAVALVASKVALTASGSIEIEQKDSVRSPHHADSLVELCRLGHNH